MYFNMIGVQEIEIEDRDGINVLVFRRDNGTESVFNADGHIKEKKDIEDIYSLYVSEIISQRVAWLKSEEIDEALAEYKGRESSNIITLDKKIKV